MKLRWPKHSFLKEEINRGQNLKWKQELWEVNQCRSHADNTYQILDTVSFSFNGYNTYERHSMQPRARRKCGAYRTPLQKTGAQRAARLGAQPEAQMILGDNEVHT